MKTIALTLTLGAAVALAALMPAVSIAHGGEDHSQDSKPAATQTHAVMAPVGSEAPARLPDGSVFLSKASQNLLGVRTVLTRLDDVSQALELKGHVRADPSAGGQVQATQMGRVVVGPSGLPALGQAVKAGQVLAWLEPVVGSIERGNQEAQLAQVRSQLSLAERRVARYEQLEGTVPQKEVDAARAELEALRQQQAALAGGITGRLPLVAPVSGRVSKLSVVAGQVVEARQALLDIVNPQRLIVEALSYDARLIGGAADFSGSTATGERLGLTLLGTGLELREQALPIQLRVVAPVPALAVGQPVNIYARLKQAQRGVVVPSNAVARNAAGEQMVWIHTGAERFVPRKVQARSLDAGTAAVIVGLSGDERVVVQGVSSLSQVR